MNVAEELVRASRELCRAVEQLRFGPPVTHVYNPLTYARSVHEEYIGRYGANPKQVVFLGMNPGPFGMVQSGVPFGDVHMVSLWLKIKTAIGKPCSEHPKRPVQGFACPRREISGQRLWGAAASHFKTAKKFFATFYVANYCPLAFLEESGRNRTPDKLPFVERRLLFAACDWHLVRITRALRPEWVIGIGSFAAGRAQNALASLEVKVDSIMHPSPASPLANRGWAEAVQQKLSAMGICRGGD